LKIPANNNISPIKLLVKGKLIFAKINIKKNIENKGNTKAIPP